MDLNLICGGVKNNHVNSIKYHVAILFIYTCSNRCSWKKKGLDEDEDLDCNQIKKNRDKEKNLDCS